MSPTPLADRYLSFTVCHTNRIFDLGYGVQRSILIQSNSMSKEYGIRFSLLTLGRRSQPRLERIGMLDIYRVSVFPCYTINIRFLDIMNSRVKDFTYGHLLCYQAAKILKVRESDLFHAHILGPDPALWLSENFKKPLVVTHHGASSKTHPIILNHHTKAFLDRSKAIICISKSVLHAFEDAGYGWKCFFIPNFTDTKFYMSPNGDKQINHSLLFIGRLIPFKDPITPVKAMSIVVKELPQAKLNILGEGSLKGKIEQLITDLRLERNVKLFGYQHDVRPYLWNSSVFIACSPYENYLSRSMMEAMCAGCVIVATDVGDTRTTLRHTCNGILVPPQNSRVMADAILRVLTDERLFRMLSKGAQETSRSFDVCTVAPQFMKVYQNALG